MCTNTSLSRHRKKKRRLHCEPQAPLLQQLANTPKLCKRRKTADASKRTSLAVRSQLALETAPLSRAMYNSRWGRLEGARNTVAQRQPRNISYCASGDHLGEASKPTLCIGWLMISFGQLICPSPRATSASARSAIQFHVCTAPHSLARSGERERGIFFLVLAWGKFGGIIVQRARKP